MILIKLINIKPTSAATHTDSGPVLITYDSMSLSVSMVKKSVTAIYGKATEMSRLFAAIVRYDYILYTTNRYAINTPTSKLLEFTAQELTFPFSEV